MEEIYYVLPPQVFLFNYTHWSLLTISQLSMQTFLLSFFCKPTKKYFCFSANKQLGSVAATVYMKCVVVSSSLIKLYKFPPWKEYFMYMFVGCFKMIMCSKSSAQPNDYKEPRLIPT